jgi:hypothetical protein
MKIESLLGSKLDLFAINGEEFLGISPKFVGIPKS